MRGIIYLILFALISTSGCASLNKSKIEKDLNDYNGIKENYAEFLNSYISDISNFRIKPIIGAIYPIGKIFRYGSYSPVDQLNFCKKDINKNQIASLPAITFNREFLLSLNTPNFVSDINGQVELDLKKSADLYLYDLWQYSVDEVTLQRKIRNADSKKQLRGIIDILKEERVAIVRGYITGKQNIVSGVLLEKDFQVKSYDIFNFKISYKNDANFKIQSKSEDPLFYILSDLAIPPELVTVLNKHIEENDNEKLHNWLSQNIIFLKPAENASFSLLPGDKSKPGYPYLKLYITH